MFGKILVIFILNAFAFLSISILIDWLPEPLILLLITGIIFTLIDKLEDKIDYTNNLFYLIFNLSSTIIYSFITIYIYVFILKYGEIFSFFFILAIGAYLLKTYLLYIGKVEEWKRKYSVKKQS